MSHVVHEEHGDHENRCTDEDQEPEHILAAGRGLGFVGTPRVAAIIAHQGTPGNSGCLFTDGGLEFDV